MFVRPDLLARHRKRHSTSYIPRNRTSSFSIPSSEASTTALVISSPTVARTRSPVLPQQIASAPRNASVLLTSESPSHLHPPATTTIITPVAQRNPWMPSSIDNVNIVRQKPAFYGHNPAPVYDQSTFAPYPGVQLSSVDGPEHGNFAMWLFE